MRFAIFIAYAALITACGTVEQNSWLSGVPREDAMEISRLIRSSTPAKKIYLYSRDNDGSISVSTDDGIYSARRVRGKWIFTKEIVLI